MKFTELERMLIRHIEGYFPELTINTTSRGGVIVLRGEDEILFASSHNDRFVTTSHYRKDKQVKQLLTLTRKIEQL